MPYIIVRDDITKMKVDAVVNAANTALAMGGGVCGAIFSAAGADELSKACDKLSPIKTGQAVITDGFNLPAKHIIHTAGPVYKDGKQDEAELLANCYKNSLKLAQDNGCESIAFPLISSGIYGYPKAEAINIATATIKEFLKTYDMEVYLAVFDRGAFEISSAMFSDIESYIDENYVDAKLARDRYRGRESELFDAQLSSAKLMPIAEVADEAPMFSCEQRTMPFELDEPFNETLFRIIDSKGKTDAEVYKRANIDRRLFSKIRSKDNYSPSKRTVLALCIALELNLDETEKLLKNAGFALSHSKKFDVIVEYFIVNGKYDIFEINNVLFHYDLELLC